MLTKHVRTRCQQRGIKEADLALIYRYGTETNKGLILTRKDVAVVEREVKKLINRLSKLQNTFVAMDGETMMTVFRATKQQCRSMFRNRYVN